MSVTNKKIVSKFYPKIYSVDDVKVFVKAGKITPDEFKEITGETYLAK